MPLIFIGFELVAESLSGTPSYCAGWEYEEFLEALARSPLKVEGAFAQQHSGSMTFIGRKT